MLAVINIVLSRLYLAAREVIPQAIASSEYLELFLKEGDQWVGSLESKVDLGKKLKRESAGRLGREQWGGGSSWQDARLHFAFGVAIPEGWEVCVGGVSPSTPDWSDLLALGLISSLSGQWGA